MDESNPTVTLADVARIAGVSKMTVSNVINDRPGMSVRTRNRVLRAIDESGYVVNSAARALAGRRVNLLGVMTPNVGTPYLAEIIHGATDAAERNGFDLAIFTTSGNVRRERERATLLRNLTDGVLLLLPVADEHQIFLGAVPVVTVSAAGPYTVLADNTHGGQLAARHLLELGHRRIAHVQFPRSTATDGRGGLHVIREDVIERQESFLRTLHEAGVSVRPEYLSGGHLSEAQAEDAARALLSLPEPPTAIFATSDTLALGVLRAALVLGLRVPEDVSVIGFDDIPEAAASHPGLTTVRQPLREMGAAAIELLCGLVHGTTPTEPQPCFPTTLIVRDSTGPPPTSDGRSRSQHRTRLA